MSFSFAIKSLLAHIDGLYGGAMPRPTSIPPVVEVERVCEFAIGEILVGRAIGPPLTKELRLQSLRIVTEAAIEVAVDEVTSTSTW